MIRISNTAEFIYEYERLPSSDQRVLSLKQQSLSLSSLEISLYEAMYVGPAFQPALYFTVVNLRLFCFAITTNAEKMFRQTGIHSIERKFQQILWRGNQSEPIRPYQLRPSPTVLQARHSMLLVF